MKKFEYKHLKRAAYSQYHVKGVSELGEQGWELVSVTFDSSSPTFHYFFKRELV